jgi:hypothetical protein
LRRRCRRLRTEEYFAERVVRGDLKKALQVLKGAGKSHPPWSVMSCLRNRTDADVSRAFTLRPQLSMFGLAVRDVT